MSSSQAKSDPNEPPGREGSCWPQSCESARNYSHLPQGVYRQEVSPHEIAGGRPLRMASESPIRLPRMNSRGDTERSNALLKLEITFPSKSSHARLAPQQAAASDSRSSRIEPRSQRKAACSRLQQCCDLTRSSANCGMHDLDGAKQRPPAP